MTANSKYAALVQMLKHFIDGGEHAHGMVIVREIEGEFARAGLHDEEEFADLQHALAMYSGREDAARSLKQEAAFAVSQLITR